MELGGVGHLRRGQSLGGQFLGRLRRGHLLQCNLGNLFGLLGHHLLGLAELDRLGNHVCPDSIDVGVCRYAAHREQPDDSRAHCASDEARKGPLCHPLLVRFQFVEHVLAKLLEHDRRGGAGGGDDRRSPW